VQEVRVTSGVEGVGVVRRESRRRWSAARAAEVLREAEGSGQNLAEFCRERELNYERVRRWRIRLSGSAKPKRAPRFIPLQVVEEQWRAVPPADESKVPGVVEFDVGGCVVRMRGEVSEAVLVRALRAAKETAGC